MPLPIRPEHVGLKPYGAPQLNVRARLNVNENPYAPPPKVVDAIAAAVRSASAGLNRYPDRDFLALRRDLARYLSVESRVDHAEPRNVWAANGSNEVMLHLHQAFGGPGRTALTFSPSYSMYPEYARDTFTHYVEVPRSPDFTVDMGAALDAIAEHQPSLVIVASPNNPTGTALDLVDVRAVLEAAEQVEGGCVVVIDEAYAEFRRPGVQSAATLVPSYTNLAVSRTMSKAFAFAGGRLGYLLAHEQLIDALRIVRLPYHLSAVTQSVARAAIAHHTVLQAQVDEIRAERDDTVDWLREQGFTVADSDANFVFFGTFDDRERVFRGLLDQGVLIRATGPEQWLRVSIGTGEEMDMFRTALLKVTR